MHAHEGFNETAEDCSPKEGCDAYPCYEKIANCGPKSYLIAFAEKYCHRFTSDGMPVGWGLVMWGTGRVECRFTDVYDRFDDEGKAFVNCTRNCLLDDMSDYFKVTYLDFRSIPTTTIITNPYYIQVHTKGIDCGGLANDAFDSHTSCE